ncbi:MAG: GNAT family N-acetyltransferase [Candidatus Eisenbacteria bacterium]|nr:GNAT family N-acetyltransferase [Candidatus Latescibacterota bacterium]MBD3301069.1 GNAT family N-acetyltransferase [Candidatus Eisenbacteria bacterium]
MSEATKVPDRAAPVTLREITEETVDEILALRVGQEQTKFVASNAKSIAQAHFCKTAWFRAIYAGESPVGFVMLDDKPDLPEYFLWRLMVDERYQRMGFGRKALDRLIEHVKTRPRATELLTSCVPGEGSPEPFYLTYGFEQTGRMEEGEKVLRLPLR